eukprot:g603.t1
MAQQPAKFGPGDIAAVIIYIILSVAIGLWASRGSSSSGRAYFLAGKGSNPCVTAVSLVSGLTSGISFLGIPGYNYKNGAVMYAFLPGYVLATAFIVHVAIPFFSRPELNLVTSYAYLGRRFSSRTMRTAAAVTFLVRSAAYMGFVLYAPALALNTAADVPIGASVCGCGVIATLYTVKGGMNSVIYTDFVASLALFLGLFLAMGYAFAGVPGGAARAFDFARHGNATTSRKLMPDGFFDFKPLAAFDFYSCMLGFGFNIAAQAGTDQIAVQRYLATADVAAARTSALVGNCLNAVMLTSLTTLGIALYGYYTVPGADGGAPPLLKSSDGIFPHFFMRVLPDGVGGMTVAALFATTMSVFSGGINSAVTCFVMDLVQTEVVCDAGCGVIGRTSVSTGRKVAGDGSDDVHSDVDVGGSGDSRVISLSKKLTLAFGLFSIVLGYLAQYLGQSLSVVSAAAQAVCNAPTFGAFLLGMLVDRAREQDVLRGFFSAVAFMVYCVVGTAACPNKGNSDGGSGGGAGGDGLHPACHTVLLPARISEWWYGPVGTFVCVAVGMVSCSLRRADGVSGLPPAARGLTWRTRHCSLAHAVDAAADSEGEGLLTPQGSEGFGHA